MSKTKTKNLSKGKTLRAFLNKEKKNSKVKFAFREGEDIIVEYNQNLYVAIYDKINDIYIVDNKYGLYRN